MSAILNLSEPAAPQPEKPADRQNPRAVIAKILRSKAMKLGILTLVGAVVLTGGGVLLRSQFSKEPAPPPVPVAVTPPPPPPAAPPLQRETADLGSVLFEETANPLGAKLPETSAEVPDPLEGAYKNPFE